MVVFPGCIGRIRRGFAGGDSTLAAPDFCGRDRRKLRRGEKTVVEMAGAGSN